jgi:hypothetical protein
MLELDDSNRSQPPGTIPTLFDDVPVRRFQIHLIELKWFTKLMDCARSK